MGNVLVGTELDSTVTCGLWLNLRALIVSTKTSQLVLVFLLGGQAIIDSSMGENTGSFRLGSWARNFQPFLPPSYAEPSSGNSPCVSLYEYHAMSPLSSVTPKFYCLSLRPWRIYTKTNHARIGGISLVVVEIARRADWWKLRKRMYVNTGELI